MAYNVYFVRCCKYIVIVSGLLILSLRAFAHLPAYEGERVRNDNHFIKEGFAQPVRGACDISAFGATDPDAGSANIYLGEGNFPPNFFCLYAAQDDWSFESPADIIEVTRTPSPDPETIGQPLEEGYIPCSEQNPNPFQCPRIIRNPTNGDVITLPGKCVDLGQPDDPAGVDGPDGRFHCALLPGAPRPRTSSVLFSTLTSSRDVDWAVYQYEPAYGEQPVVAASQVPACRENIGVYVTHAYLGPLSLRDARTGKPLFRPANKVGWLPPQVRHQIPSGYGVRVTRPSRNKVTKASPRLGYASGYGQNGWLLATDSVVECIDDFEKCLADTTGELSQHYKHNDIFFINEDKPVKLYLAWWVAERDRGIEPDGGRRRLIDVSITTGVIDQFIIGDFINIGVTGPFAGNGRYIHGRCSDPRKTSLVEMVIETN